MARPAPTRWTITMEPAQTTVSIPEGSINDQVAALPTPQKFDRSGPNRVPAEMRGRLFFLPRVGLVVTPTVYRPNWMGCTVVTGNDRYPQGGYDICVGNDELDKAIELAIDVERMIPDGEAP